MKLLLFIIIYLIGFIWTYLVVKKVRDDVDENNWHDVIFTIFLSLCSYAGLLLFYSVGAAYGYYKPFSKYRKPPKWL